MPTFRQGHILQSYSLADKRKVAQKQIVFISNNKSGMEAVRNDHCHREILKITPAEGNVSLLLSISCKDSNKLGVDLCQDRKRDDAPVTVTKHREYLRVGQQTCRVNCFPYMILGLHWHQRDKFT